VPQGRQLHCSLAAAGSLTSHRPPRQATGTEFASPTRGLHLIEGTVKIHVSAILSKLRVDNCVQAAVLAHEASLPPGQHRP
jgi:hypothetical protein